MWVVPPFLKSVRNSTVGMSANLANMNSEEWSGCVEDPCSSVIVQLERLKSHRVYPAILTKGQMGCSQVSSPHICERYRT